MPIIEELEAKRVQQQKMFLLDLKDPGIQSALQDNDVFRRVLKLVVNDYGVRQLDLADALGTSAAAVSRWLSGDSRPPAYSRRHVLEAVEVVLEAKLSESSAPMTDEEPPHAAVEARPGMRAAR